MVIDSMVYLFLLDTNFTGHYNEQGFITCKLLPHGLN